MNIENILRVNMATLIHDIENILRINMATVISEH
jgi:hypothetical protein